MAIIPTPLSRTHVRLLVILALINLVNFADRTVILPLFPVLRDEFTLSGTELGGLQTVLQIVLSSATIPLALLADRVNRTRIIAYGVLFWSVATFFTGLAASYGLLLIARALVGVGEAAYGPAAQSMISGAFPVTARARVQAIFAAGMLIGGAVGQGLGGIVGDAVGWRPAFFVVGIPGLVLALTVLGLEEPPRGPKAELVPLGRLLRVPVYVALLGCGVLITFSSIAFITWGPDFVVRFKGFSLREAGISLGTAGLISLVLGALVGGAVADALQKRWAAGRVLAVGAGFLLAAPFAVWALNAEEKAVVLFAFFIAAFFMSWYHGPVTAILHDLTPPRAHATVVGVYMFVTQLLGGTMGPLVVGTMDDLVSLRAGLKLALAVMVIGAVCFFGVAWLIHRRGLRHPLLQHDSAAL